MDTITIDKTKLITKMTENRSKHKDDFEKALINYKEEAAKRYLKYAHDAQNGDPFPSSLGLNPPTNYLESYDDVVSMLENSNDTTVELDKQQYRQFFLDKWNWSEGFKTAVSGYISKSFH